MATTYYIDQSGNFLGGFDGAEPPTGSIEIIDLPPSALYTYVSGSWVEPADWYTSQRRDAYNISGSTIDNLIVALWEDVVENRTGSMETIQAIREAVKIQYPKPE